MPEQMTTQVTASTEVARAAPTSVLPVDLWWAAIVAGVVAIGALVKLADGIMGIVDRVRSWRKDGDQAEQGELGQLEARLGKRIDGVADENRTFRAAADIDRDMAAIRKDLEHEKAQRVAGGEAATAAFADDRRRLSELERSQTRLETKFEGQAAGLARVEVGLDKLRDQIDDLPGRLASVMAKS